MLAVEGEDTGKSGRPSPNNGTMLARAGVALQTVSRGGKTWNDLMRLAFLRGDLESSLLYIIVSTLY